MGNAGFEQFLIDVTRHHDVSYHRNEAKVACAVNSFFFQDLEASSGKVFKVKMSKKIIKCDLPIQIGFFVPVYAKLKMLEFYNRFIDVYLDKQDFQYLKMDRYSAYMS